MIKAEVVGAEPAASHAADQAGGALQDALDAACTWHAAGEAVALATVLQTWGSAPRPVGAQMAVTASGLMAGSVSGGCVEAAVAEAALETLHTGAARIVQYGVSNDQAWELGLPCGGQITVLVEPLA